MSKEKNTKEKGVGFIASLKTKPQTLEEAKHRTKNMCILTGIIFGVFVILFSILHILLGLLWAVASVGIIAFLYFQWNQKDKRNFCSKCGTKIDYENCVAWEVTDYDEKSLSVNPDRSGKQAVKKRVATVLFTCTCAECGETKSFTKNYDVVIWYNDGTKKENSIESLAKSYFKL